MKYDFPLNKVYIKYDLHVITSPKYHFLCEDFMNYEWHGLKNIWIAHASTEGASKYYLDMLIGR